MLSGVAAPPAPAASFFLLEQPLQMLDPIPYPPRLLAVTPLLPAAAAGGIPLALPARRAPSAGELRAMQANGGRCSIPVYRAAWAMAHTYRLPPAVVVAVIEAESACRSDAISKTGARGLMQLMPGDGARVAYRMVYGRDEPPSDELLRDPQANIRLGVAYLRALHDHFAYVSSAEARLVLAIAAYNCGTGLFDDKLPDGSEQWAFADMHDWIARHAPHETRDYVQRVVQEARRYSSVLAAARADEAALMMAQ
jgi:soluble lytic murein transglycosylase-like protein